ncbi:MAG: hypothetical protein M8357_16360 [Desulfobulbaceae bacterium]|nr:hypothetical protein [Desulfobulbaceae bacterium]
MNKQSEPGLRKGPGYLEVIAISLLTAALTVLGYHKMYAQKIKVLDLKGYLRTQKALLVAGEINEDRWKASLDKLEEVLNREASDPNHVILLKEVVLKNGDEIRVE